MPALLPVISIEIPREFSACESLELLARNPQPARCFVLPVTSHQLIRHILECDPKSVILALTVNTSVGICQSQPKRSARISYHKFANVCERTLRSKLNAFSRTPTGSSDSASPTHAFAVLWGKNCLVLLISLSKRNTPGKRGL
jgi:hypothetical protein